MVYGRSVQSQHPPQWYTIKSHLQLWLVTASFVSSSLKMGKLIFIWAPASPHCLPLWGCWEPSDKSDSNDIDEAVNTKLLPLSNPWSGDGNGVEVVEAPGLFYIYYGSGPSEASETIVYGLNCHLWECPSGENLPISQIWMVVGLTDSCMDASGPSPLSGIWLWPRQSPTDLK